MHLSRGEMTKHPFERLTWTQVGQFSTHLGLAHWLQDFEWFKPRETEICLLQKSATYGNYSVPELFLSLQAIWQVLQLLQAVIS
jgi:hypothetical protein